MIEILYGALAIVMTCYIMHAVERLVGPDGIGFIVCSAVFLFVSFVIGALIKIAIYS